MANSTHRHYVGVPTSFRLLFWVHNSRNDGRSKQRTHFGQKFLVAHRRLGVLLVTIKVLEQILDDGSKPSPKGTGLASVEPDDGAPNPFGGLLGDLVPIDRLQPLTPPPHQRQIKGVEPLPRFGVVFREPKEQRSRSGAGLNCHSAYFIGRGEKGNRVMKSRFIL